MIFWTVQRKQAWEQFQLNGTMSGNRSFMDDWWATKYQWMMEQMRKRIKGYGGKYPVWVWTERPDLRQSALLSRGTEGVLLKLELPPEKVLLSDFDAWHIVLNEGYVGLSEQELDLYYNDKETPITAQESWERIFDLQAVRWDSECGEYQTQGVVEEIKLSQVLHVKPFIAR